MNTTFHFYLSKLSPERHGITVLLSKQTASHGNRSFIWVRKQHRQSVWRVSGECSQLLLAWQKQGLGLLPPLPLLLLCMQHHCCSEACSHWGEASLVACKVCNLLETGAQSAWIQVAAAEAVTAR